MRQIRFKDFPDVEFGSNVLIEGENVSINPGTRILDGVKISAKNIQIGFDCVIEEECIIKGLNQPMDSFILGDNCLIGFRNQIFVPNFSMQDFSQIHNSGLHSGYKPLTLGYNCWVGQNTILNATETLKICNNVRIGTQSQLWTHVASGELLEGCTLYGNKPLILEDNVWIVGGAVISPGLLLGHNSIVMTGSVLTKSTEPYHTYAGVPAKDVTEKLNFWKSLEISEKFEMLKDYVEQFREAYPEFKRNIKIYESENDIDEEFSVDNVYIFKYINSLSAIEITNCSIFNLEDKRYFKRRTTLEILWIKFNIGFRARFIPYN